MIACLVSVALHGEITALNAFLATVVLVVSVGLSMALGVATSYWVVRMVLGAFGSKASQPVVMERARAAAAGD